MVYLAVLLWVALVGLFLLATTMQAPPAFVLPRLVFLAGLAILVLRRCRDPASFTFLQCSILSQVCILIIISNLALCLIWDQAEKVIHFLITSVNDLIQKCGGTGFACENCTGVDGVHFWVTTGLALALLFWALYSILSRETVERFVQKLVFAGSVKLFSHVEVRFINDENHSTENSTTEPIKAPAGPGKNPIVFWNS